MRDLRLTIDDSGLAAADMQGGSANSQEPTAISRCQLRRGNTIVLVMGILVLLAIIGTAYVSRTQAGRITGSAAGRTDNRENMADLVSDMVARDIADALFPRSIDTSLLPVANINNLS